MEAAGTFYASIRQHAVHHFAVRHRIRVKCIVAYNFHRRDTLCKLSPLKSCSVKLIRLIKNKLIRCDCSIKLSTISQLIHNLDTITSLQLADALPYSACHRESISLVIVGCRTEKFKCRNLLYSLKSFDFKRYKSALLTGEYRMRVPCLDTYAGCTHHHVIKILNLIVRLSLI